MAYYHENLKYHEDTTMKREISKEDRDFLRKLQLEMNTQDNCGTCDPRFWVIKGSEKVRDYENPDFYGLIHDGETVAEETKSMCDYLNENILPDCDVDRTDCRIEAGCMLGAIHEFVLRYKNYKDEDDCEYMDADDLNEFLYDHGYDDVEVVGIAKRPIIYPNTMFLTEKDARNHLEANHYHYSEDAHTYCMSAWRSPAVGQLWKILQKVQW